MAKFNPRDVVQLNSGGPLMTVWKASTTIKKLSENAPKSLSDKGKNHVLG